MRLIDLNPRWAVTRQSQDASGVFLYYNDGRIGMGLTFDCPHCRETRLGIFFLNPIDGKAPAEGVKLWQCSGVNFETLTLSPSIDASASGHWHGFIESGEVR